MIPGIHGTLLSSAYLARHVDGHSLAGDHGFDAWARTVVRWWRRNRQALGPASAPRAVLDVGARPLLDLLGHGVRAVEPHSWGQAALVSSAAAATAPFATLLCTAWGAPPDGTWRQALRTSLAARMRWALIFNGQALTIVDGSQPWSRRRLTFQFDLVCRDARAMRALWLLTRTDAFATDGPASLGQAVAASDAHGVTVCAALGDGVLDALGELVAALDTTGRSREPRGPRHAMRVFDQSLTIVYRLLFLFFAEARHLVPLWHQVYREAYSMDALCRRLLREPRARGVWATLQAMSRLAHSGCHADDLRVTAFNGRLFAPARTPLAETRRVPDASASRVVMAIGTSSGRQGRQPIAFHDLGVEQLGAVYERVLDYEPVRTARTLTLRSTATVRKTTGSFYTPRAVTDFLVRRTLGPLVEGRSSAAILGLRVIDPAMGSGAFLVSACRYLTERAEQARLAEGAWLEGAVSDAERAELSRAIAERCLFGLDINPTAVQLARLSLWLTTLAEDRPLTFLDHHLGVGNSLVGARLADLAHAPPGPLKAPGPGGPQLALFDAAALEQLARSVVPERHRLANEPSTTSAAVRDKERRLHRLLEDDAGLRRWARAADLWCGLTLDGTRAAPGLYAELQRHVAGLPTALTPRQCGPSASRALALARAHGACHWELAFPEVFLDQDGEPLPEAGFDAVLGNPPWEMMRADTGDASCRADARPDVRALLRFVRGSGHYPLQGRGHVNQYQLFVERALQALRPGGRFGLILPSGIQSDVGSADLRRALVDTCRVDTWLAFENRKGIFPIHRSMRFVLLAGDTAGPTSSLPVSGHLTDPSALHHLPDNPRAETPTVPSVQVSREFLHRWDPTHLTIPALATALEHSVAWRALAAPALSSSEGWQVRFGRELNATDDSAHFVDWRLGEEARSDELTGPAGAMLPVVDGRHLRPFGVALDGVRRGIARERAAQLIDADASYGRARVCYRDVASASNRLTLIAAVLPPAVVSTHTIFCAKQALSLSDAWCLVGLLNSLVANFLVRLQMSTHVTTALMARLPVPRPAAGSADHTAIATLAEALSHAPVIEDDSARYAQVNALAARQYGLSAQEYAHLISTFPLLPEALRVHLAAAYLPAGS